MLLPWRSDPVVWTTPDGTVGGALHCDCQLACSRIHKLCISNCAKEAYPSVREFHAENWWTTLLFPSRMDDGSHKWYRSEPYIMMNIGYFAQIFSTQGGMLSGCFFSEFFDCSRDWPTGWSRWEGREAFCRVHPMAEVGFKRGAANAA